MNLPPLYHCAKKGEIRVWRVWTEGPCVFTEYGVLNGEMIISRKSCEGKNLGKNNSTTPEQQAEVEAKSLWKFKKDRKYSETIEEAQEPLVLPMLAKPIEDRYAVYPGYGQPKFDGVRCLAFWQDDKIMLISRAGKEWAVVKHIASDLELILPKDCMFDGELYRHGLSCQTITSYVKKLRMETLSIKYYVYDMPVIYGDDTKPYKYRLQTLEQLWSDNNYWDNTPVVFVKTAKINSYQEIRDYESKMISYGYEGAIFRNAEGIYQFGYRSNDLLKVKTFQDAEFKVIGCREGSGAWEGCAVFLCQNDLTDATFECVSPGSLENKAQIFKNKDKYIGRMLTVKFFDRTDDKKPRFGVGKCFRSKEDLPFFDS